MEPLTQTDAGAHQHTSAWSMSCTVLRDDMCPGRSRASGSRIALRTLPVSSSSRPRGASPTCAAGGLPVCCRGRVIAGREVLAVPLLQRPPALPCVQPESRRRLKHRQPRPRGSRAALLPGPAAHGQLQASRPAGNPQALTTAARRQGKPLQLPAQQRLVRGQSGTISTQGYCVGIIDKSSKPFPIIVELYHLTVIHDWSCLHFSEEVIPACTAHLSRNPTLERDRVAFLRARPSLQHWSP
nr:uncharacterized protein LOC112060277 [Chrysemys picta bellii]